EVDRHRVLRLVRRPRLERERVRRGGPCRRCGRRRPPVPAAARPRVGRPGSAAAPLRPPHRRRGPHQPPARRPLLRPQRLLRAAQVPPRRSAAEAADLGSPGAALARRPRLRPAARAGDGRGVHVPAGQEEAVPGRAVPGHRAARRPPRRGVRLPHRARRQGAGVLRGHRRLPTVDRAGAGRRPAAGGGGVPRRRRQPAARAHDRLAGSRHRRRGGGRAAGPHPRAAVARRPGRVAGGQGSLHRTHVPRHRGRDVRPV
ncbi:MAG: Metal-dependent hydrolases of the beta-lactamase superfamily III, partial [uncultured Nocardioidaceae bacterium]